MNFPSSALRSRIERHIVLIIPLVASLIFLNQIYRQHAHDLSVWKGGGMGMFAALDRPRSTRFVKIYITDSDNIRMPVIAYDELTYRIQVEPSEKNLDRLLSKIVNTPWRYSQQRTPILERQKDGSHIVLGYTPKPTPWGRNELIDVSSIDIEYGQIYFDVDTKLLEGKLIKERHYEFSK
jgi:hypothetical protein